MLNRRPAAFLGHQDCKAEDEMNREVNLKDQSDERIGVEEKGTELQIGSHRKLS